MKVTELIKNLIRSDSGYSSKRMSGMILILFSIVVPIICIFLDPIGQLDDSILVFSAQLMISGCSLLGFTLKESNLPTKSKKDLDKNKCDLTKDN